MLTPASMLHDLAMRAVYDYKAKHGKAQEGMLAYDKEKAILGVAIDKTE